MMILPRLKKMMVGVPVISYWEGTKRFVVVSILTNLTLPVYCRASSSRTGANRWL